MTERPEVITVYEARGHDVYIGRNEYNDINVLNGDPEEYGWLGNPHPVDEPCSECDTVHDRHEAIVRFKEDFFDRLQNDEEFKEAVLDLEGKTLGCFCKPKPCHGDVIAEWVEKQWHGDFPVIPEEHPGYVDMECPECGDNKTYRTCAPNGVKCRSCGNTFKADPPYEPEDKQKGQQKLTEVMG